MTTTNTARRWAPRRPRPHRSIRPVLTRLPSSRLRSSRPRPRSPRPTNAA